MSVKVTDVVKGSPADKAHIQKGDILEKINGNEISDVLDYMYYSAESRFFLSVFVRVFFWIVSIMKKIKNIITTFFQYVCRPFLRL